MDGWVGVPGRQALVALPALAGGIALCLAGVGACHVPCACACFVRPGPLLTLLTTLRSSPLSCGCLSLVRMIWMHLLLPWLVLPPRLSCSTPPGAQAFSSLLFPLACVASPACSHLPSPPRAAGLLKCEWLQPHQQPGCAGLQHRPDCPHPAGRGRRAASGQWRGRGRAWQQRRRPSGIGEATEAAAGASGVPAVCGQEVSEGWGVRIALWLFGLCLFAHWWIGLPGPLAQAGVLGPWLVPSSRRRWGAGMVHEAACCLLCMRHQCHLVPVCKRSCLAYSCGRP